MDTTRLSAPNAQHSGFLSRLRPRDVGGLLDQAVVLYRRNFITYIGIAAVMQVPASLVLTIATIFLLDPANIARPPSLPPRGSDPNALAGYNAALAASVSDTLSRTFLVLLISIFSAILTNIAAGALARAIAAGYMGHKLGVLDAYRAIRHQIPRLIGLILLVGLSSIISIIPPLFIWIFINWSFGTQAIVLENTTVSGGLQRSWDLVRGSWWRVFGAYLLLLIIGIVVSFSDSIATPLLAFTGLSWALQSILSQFISLLTTLLYVPVRMAGMTLLYFDLRVRKEGFDLQIALDERAAEVGLEPAAPVLPLAPGQAPAPVWPYRPAAPAVAAIAQEPASG